MLGYQIETRERYIMNNIDNKELLLAAIEDYELYSLSHRNVLKILIAVAIDNIASVTVQYLMKAAKLSRPSIFKIIRELEQDHFIERIRLSNTRHDSFQINELKLNQIIKLYHNKKMILDK